MIARRRRPDFSWAALVSSLLLVAAAGRSSDTLHEERAQDGGLTIDHLLSIAHPGPPVWSPSGERIAFLRERDGAVDLWWTAEGREQAVASTRIDGHRVRARGARSLVALSACRVATASSRRLRLAGTMGTGD